MAETKYAQIITAVNTVPAIKKDTGFISVAETNILEKLLLHIANPNLVKQVGKPSYDDARSVDNKPGDNAFGIVFKNESVAKGLAKGLSEKGMGAEYLGEMDVYNAPHGHVVQLNAEHVMGLIKSGKIESAYNTLKASGALKDDFDVIRERTKSVCESLDVTSKSDNPECSGTLPPSVPRAAQKAIRK